MADITKVGDALKECCRSFSESIIKSMFLTLVASCTAELYIPSKSPTMLFPV